MRPAFLLIILGTMLVSGHVTRAEDALASPSLTPTCVLVPGKALKPKAGECRDLSRDEELFTVDIARGERTVSTIYRQRLATQNREVSLQVPGTITWLRVSATGRYLAFGTEAKETFLAAPFGGDGDWRTWKLAASPWVSACFSLGEDYLLGCPATRDHFEGVSLATAPMDAAPEIKGFPVDPGYKFGKLPALVPLPEHRFLVDAAGLILHEDGTADKAPVVGSEDMYDFLVGPTVRGWVIHVRQQYDAQGPYSIMVVQNVQLLAHAPDGSVLTLPWDPNKRIEQAWIGRDDTLWLQFYGDNNADVPWLHPYRIESADKPVSRKKRR